jgi:ABC-type uncharacterized transport system substrate-binding protein
LSPIRLGAVSSAAWPDPAATSQGGRTRGLELREKYLELLKEAVPDAIRFGVLWNSANPVHPLTMGTIEAAARRLKVELYPVGAQEPKELEGAFSALAAKRVEALVVFPDGMFIAQTSAIVGLAARRHLPAMYGVRGYAEAGGLMAYGTNLLGMFRLSASFVDKILKGAKLGNLPVEQPTKFELVINLKTAKALGLTIPPSLLARADEVIQ